MGTNFKFAKPTLNRDGTTDSIPFLGRVVVSQSGGYEVLNLGLDIYTRLRHIEQELKKANIYHAVANDFVVENADVEVD